MISSQAMAASRGISVNLKASEKAGAPFSESVELYENSYALVIGNDAYYNGWPKLTNAVKDAELIAEALEEKGFEIELHKNLESNELNAVFKKFFILKGNDPGARLFVWYAGHGQTLDGEGYLVPVDAPVPSKAAEFKFSAVALRDFGTYMRQALSKHAYAVFDSCFAGSVFSSQRAMPPPAITRATTLPVRQFLTSGDENQTVADDGSFRELFIRAIKGEERSDANGDGYVTASELGMFLGDRITNLTQSVQTPRYGKLRDKDYDRGDFVFVLPEGAAGSSGLELAPKTASVQASTQITFWKSIEKSNNIGSFEAYLKQYPKGSFVTLARLRITELQQQLQPKAPRPREVFEVAFLDRDFEASRVANVRESPFPTANKVARLEKGALVWAIGETETKGGKWYKVARDGLELGFVYAPLLKETSRVDGEMVVKPLALPEPVVSEKAQAEEVAEQQPETTTEERPSVAESAPAAKPVSTRQLLSLLVDDLLDPVEQKVVATVAEQRAEQPSRIEVTSRSTPSGITSSGSTPSGSNPGGRSAGQTPGIDRSISEQSRPAGQIVSSNQQLAQRVASLDHVARQPVATGKHVVMQAQTTESGRHQAAQQASIESPRVTSSTSPAMVTDPTRTAAVAAVVEKDSPSAGVSPQTASQPSKQRSVAKTVVKSSEVGQTAQQVALLQTEARTTPAKKPSDYIKRYIAAADSGNVRAQTSLAYMYETGQQVEVNKQQAVFWYRKAADMGDIQAQLNLGLMYENGDGIPQDFTEAAFWYRKAAIKGDADAQQTLGYMYEYGRGLVKDVAEAAWWYTKAAEQGKVAAQNNLGRLYQLGLGIPADKTKAIFWYGKAAEQGSKAARKNLSDLTQ